MEINPVEEVTRKALEQVEALENRRLRGIISNREFKIAFDAVIGSVLGIAQGANDWIDFVNEAKITPGPLLTVLSNGQMAYLVCRDGCSLKIARIPDGKAVFEHEFPFSEDAAAKYREFVSRMQAQNYTVYGE